MPRVPVVLKPENPLVVGCFGDAASLNSVTVDLAAKSCDLIEIRLDLLAADPAVLEASPWRRFGEIPLLFTARRGSEGGQGDLDATTRMDLLRPILADASLIDIEVASIPEMQPLLGELSDLGIPWIASFHDFNGVPGTDVLSAHRMAARHAGAVGFKAALQLGWEMDQLGALPLFLQQSPDFPISLMGMGPLAPVSRLLFAQLGSVLNYGYLGDTPTAPGQWSARQLKNAIGSVKKSR